MNGHPHARHRGASDRYALGMAHGALVATCIGFVLVMAVLLL